MPRILNYKSYYEAFKLGVVDDGFTPVARLLFFPLFDPKGSIVLCDENDVPYPVKKYHHTLTQILGGLLKIGFILEAIEEAMPSEEMIPVMPDEMRRPMMLLVRVRKTGCTF